MPTNDSNQDAPKSATVIIKSNVQHNGAEYTEGDKLELPVNQAKDLVEAGAAEFDSKKVKGKPADKADEPTSDQSDGQGDDDDPQDDKLPDADELVAGNSKAKLLELAEAHGVETDGLRNKAEIANAIVDARD